MNYTESDLNRFNSKWIEDDLSGCWVWQGSHKNGPYPYALFWLGNNNVIASRLSYLISNGPLIDGYEIHHSCKRYNCVNPDHLEQLSPIDHGSEARKLYTRCVNNHDLTSEENIYTYPNGNRACKECRLEWAKIHNRVRTVRLNLKGA